MKIKYQVPRVYEQILPKDLLQMDLVETKATCDACIMAKPKNRGAIFYEDYLKCCTFHPFLPNYAVGAMLTEPAQISAEARSAIRGKISRREYSLPLGLVAPVSYQVEFNHRKENEFGQREDWLCPYFDRDKQNCGIWRHRGAVCTSFHCKSSHGVRGQNYWSELSNYMTYVEMALMEEALVMLDFSPRQIGDLLGYINRFEGTAAELKSPQMALKTARSLWNGYFDDQEGFYKKCFQIVGNLDRKTYRELIGEPGKRLEENLRKAFGKACP
ncbi:MAG: hypothetical protein H7326_09465 [Bdellovibrionaceae bacterium]|nr:hypothetical protein [Pseudobdellovibrionaceae bacterium]